MRLWAACGGSHLKASKHRKTIEHLSGPNYITKIKTKWNNTKHIASSSEQKMKHYDSIFKQWSRDKSYKNSVL